MLNFYPGPSKIYPSVKSFASEAFDNQILEKNHRSLDFMNLLGECIYLFKKHLNIPNDYQVFFTSSATECWEISAQSFLKGPSTLFFFNGAFGQKWANYSERILGTVQRISYVINQEIQLNTFEHKDLCFVANETSNATGVSIRSIQTLRAKNLENLIIIDAVSSLGGVNYDISQADIWISSTQKCFGLPSGMGILIVSPKAMARAKEINERNHYNSALFLQENFLKNQTPYTPNILNIYLLKRLMDSLDPIAVISEKIRNRAEIIYDYFKKNSSIDILIENKAVRSETVIAIQPKNLAKLSNYLDQHHVILGKGYGDWRDSTLRIANFPAIPDQHFALLFKILDNFAD